MPKENPDAASGRKSEGMRATRESKATSLRLRFGS